MGVTGQSGQVRKEALQSERSGWNASGIAAQVYTTIVLRIQRNSSLVGSLIVFTVHVG